MKETETKNRFGFAGKDQHTRWGISFMASTSDVCISGVQHSKRLDLWSHFKFHVSPDLARQMSAELIEVAEAAEAKRGIHTP